VIANAGCANACTGLAAWRMPADGGTHRAALGCDEREVLVLSTGVIVAISTWRSWRVHRRGRLTIAVRGAAAASRAILTTDTRPKTAAMEVTIGGRDIAIRAFAKGAA